MFSRSLIGLTLLLIVAHANAQVTAAFNVNYQSPNCSPTVVSFVNQSTGAGALTYQWNFGIVAGVNSTQQNPSTTFLQCGNYNVTLKVTNASGQISTVTHAVHVDCQPIANFTLSQASGCLPLSVTFNSGVSQSGNANITSYQWDFGDGYGSTSANPTHVYTTSGCKNVTLVITNANGCIDDTTIVNAVCPTPPPVGNFTSTNPIGCAYPFNVTYTATPSGTNPPFTYQWTFQGGTPNTSTQTNPTVTYNSGGSYWSRLVITDANGCKDTVTKYNYVVVASSATDFTLNATSGCAPFSFVAQALNTQFASSMSWTCSGGMMSGINTPDNVIYFNTPGSYQLCLTMTFPGNCTATKCSTLVVKPTPTANFNATGMVPTCQPPLNINFTNSSTGTGLTYQWLLPGSTTPTSTQTSPQNVLYNACGSHDVTLIATNSVGCKDTMVQPALVHIDCPDAHFAISTGNNCAPLDVAFNSTQSSGNPVQWYWNFGDTTNINVVQSTQQNPSHVFTQTGCFTVRLIIVNTQGCRDTIVAHNAVCVGSPPNVDFSASPTVACAGVPIQFTNLSTNTTPYNTYFWNFLHVPPYSTMSTAKNPSYAYADTGTFDVTLISCLLGCCDTITKHDYITIKAPVAKILLTRNCTDIYTVTLHGEQSLGADTYSWSIPGGTPSSSTSPTVVVTYPATGDYTATLTVTNIQTGCSHTTTQTVHIRDVHADFYLNDTAACAPHVFCFINASQDGSTYQWKVWNQWGQLVATNTQTSPCQAYGVPGIWTVQLIATDVNGCSDTLIKHNAFRTYGVAVGMTAVQNATFGCAPFTAQFHGTAISSVTSTPVSFQWDFGDPSSGSANHATTQDALHTYNNAGIYTVGFSVTDDHGCVCTSGQIDYIHVEKPNAAFTSVDSSVCLSTPVCYTNQTTGLQPVTYQWDFGDGSPMSNALSPCHVYSDTGYYTATLYATDGWGCKDTLVKTLYAHVSSPSAGFVADSTQTSCPPLAVHFTNTSSGVDSMTHYHWDFGDGATSTASNPFHIYTYSGSFTVTLALTTSDGCVDTLVIPDYIVLHGPVANVNVTPTQGCSPLNVCFHALSANSITYTWNYGDGTVVTGVDTSCYTYTTPGVFLPQVILNDGVGCVYSLPLDTITVGEPHASFHADHHYLCLNGIVHFTDSSSSNVPISQRLWNFGDPASGANNTSTQTNPAHNFSTQGNFIITLTVTNSFGCIATHTDTIHVTDAPLAAFTSVPGVCPGGIILFNNTTQSASPVSTYAWTFGDPSSGANDTSSLDSPSHAFASAGTYNVALTVTAINGCTGTVQHTVTVYANPIANAGPDKNICFGNTTSLTASGGTGYAWTPSSSLNSSSNATVTSNTTATTTYTVTVTDVHGCTASDAAVVFVHALPVVSAGIDKTICPGLPTTMQSTGASSYQWSPSTGLSQTNISSPSASPTITTQYIVIGTNAAGCTATDTVMVNVLPHALANAGPDQAICFGTSSQLNGSGGVTYQWQPASSLGNANTSSPVAQPQQTTTYTLTITDSSGCQGTDQMVLTVNPLPQVSAGADQTICLGSSAMLQASGAVNYQWQNDPTLDATSISNPLAQPIVTQSYIVTGTDGIGCSGTDTVTITVIQPFKVQVNPGADVCQGAQVQLSASGGATYRWTPAGSLDNPNVAEPYASPMENTTYQVVAYDGICFSDSADVIVNVHALPNADAGADQIILSGETVTLGATGNGNYSWSPPDGLSCTTCANPDATPASTTTYTVTVTNDHGCQRRDEVIIMVGCKDEVVFIPNAFTPNGDGLDDVFLIRSHGVKVLNYLRVFDRWGNVIFESHDQNVGWDGTYRNQPVTPGTYVFTLEAVCSNGQTVMRQGNVTLIR